MKINKSKVLFVFFYILFTSVIGYSQTIGKIFSKEEANNLFGNVIESVSINKSDLISVLNQTQNYIMFQLNGGELIILGDGRNVLSPIGKIVSSNEVFALFSKSKVAELVNLGSGYTVIVEKRLNHLTMTFGLFTLEESMWCPPFCP